MSITSFSKPSDTDVLNKFIKKDQIISFVGEGSIYQNSEETFYIRFVKVQANKEEIIKKVVYIKKGISWLFNRIEQA
jgi:hypothetical protein